MEWGWDRDRCIRAIQEAGLPLPGKSSCFFCPSMKRRGDPHSLPPISGTVKPGLTIEDRARPHLTAVEGAGPELGLAGLSGARRGTAGASQVFPEDNLPCSCGRCAT